MKIVAGEADGAALACSSATLEWYPSEGVAVVLAVGYAPAEPVFAGGFSFVGVLLADFLDGAAADMAEGSAASLAELVEVEAGEVLFVLSVVVSVCLVAVVPDGVGLSSHLVEQLSVSVLNPESESLDYVGAHVCTIQVVFVGYKGAGAVSALALTFLSSSP